MPDNEEERIKKLEFLDLLDLGKDPELDVFAEVASLITNCPVSLISIMAKGVQNINSCVGLLLDTVKREDTVCQHVIASKEILIINDTLLDERTVENALVLEGGIRFYLGIPLIDEEGFVLGTLCVIDYQPKELSDRQIATLQKIAEAITKILISKKKNIQTAYFEQTFSITNNLICVLDSDFNLKDLNPAFQQAFQFNKNEALHQNFLNIVGDHNTEVKTLLKKRSIKDELLFTTSTVINPESTVIVEWFLKENDNNIFCYGRNITDQIADDLKLKNSERRFRNFFQNAIGLMSIHDLEGNILSVNQKGRELLNYSEEEIKGLDLKDLVPEKNWPSLHDYLLRIAENKEDFGNMLLRKKDGEEVIWMYHNMLEKDEEGKPYVISTALNVTERVTLEKDLIYTKKILEQTNIVAQVGGWQLNLKKNTVYWSQSVKEIHKVQPDFVPTLDSAVRFFQGKNMDKLNFLLERAIKDGIPYDDELQLVRADGVVIWVRVKGVPEFEDGICIKVFGIIQDIDTTKKIYLELAEKEAMLQSFVKYVPVSVAMFDRKLRYLSASTSWKNEFYMNDTEIIGEHIFTISPNVSEERSKIYFDALEGKAYKNEKLAIKIANKEEIQNYCIEISPWYLTEDTIGGVIVSAQNITDSVKINEELLKAKVTADIASKAKSEFLSNMSHEIRTPLNSVIGFSDLLLKTPLNEMQSQYLNYINESGENLLSIINDILDFSKIESGKMDLLVDKSNIYDMVSQVVNVILYQSQRKNIELLLNIEQGLPKTLWLDESRIKQVLINLLGNAVKFTDHGEIELKVEKINILNENITLRFSVRDTGIGIPLEKQHRIFDAFTQEDSSVSKKYGGTGLGLTISNNILKYMDSHLSISSELQKGSVFYFDITIPFETASFDDHEELNIDRVLIVDDNENNRIILQHMLTYKNINSKLAANGMEALQILMAGERFDVILMDYHMPIISGLETIEKIKKLFDKEDELSPLIILHTSSEEHDVINSFRQNEKSFCLLKPIKSEELYTTLRRAVNNKVKYIEEATASQEKEPSDFPDALRVLLVDDNPVNMVLCSKMMQSLIPQVQLTEKVDGLQALNSCKNNTFDLILMDVQMPIMDGIEATKQIRLLPQYSKVPIIGVTAGSILGEKEKCLAAGMNDFLPKPLRQANLLEKLHAHIDLHDPNQSGKIIENDQYLDLQLMNERIGDDEEFRILFLNLVVQELTLSQDNLKNAVRENNINTIKMILHKLKGTAGTAGLIKLAEASANWEEKIEKQGDYAYMAQQIKAEIEIGLDLMKELLNYQ